MNILLATLGQRPQAITFAYDLLSKQIHFSEIGIIHTEPMHSDISDSLQILRRELHRSYPTVPVQYHEIRMPDGAAIIDIQNEQIAAAYHAGLLQLLLHYKRCHATVHFMLAGGRKEMGMYGILAASVLFDAHDHVWTVHTPSDLIESGQFHIPPGEQDRVSMISLPFLPTRLAPEHLQTMTTNDVANYVATSRNRRELLTQKLTRAQRKIVDAIALNPDATAGELAASVSLAEKTVERHLQDIYQTMRATFDYGERGLKHPGQALRDILLED